MPSTLVHNVITNLTNMVTKLQDLSTFNITIDAIPVLNQELLTQTITKVLATPDLEQQLEFMYNPDSPIEAQYGIRFAKNESQPRSALLLRTSATGLVLIIFTNCKVVSGAKDFTAGHIGSGTMKNVKLCFIMNRSTIIPYARARIDLGNDPKTVQDSLYVIRNEILFSNKHHSSKVIVTSYISNSFTRTRKDNTVTEAIYLFSELATCSLDKIFKVLSTEESLQINQELQAKSIPILFLNIIRNVLQALDEINDKGDIHCDVKSANVFLYEGRHAKLADFGLAQSKADNGLPISTFTHAAPQVFMANTKKDSNANYYNTLNQASNQWFSFGFYVYQQMSQQQNNGQPIEKKLYADEKDDIWSVGIILLDLLTKNIFFPIKNSAEVLLLYRQLISQHDLLQHLLAPNREQRPTPKEAIAMVDYLLQAIQTPAQIVTEEPKLETTKKLAQETEASPSSSHKRFRMKLSGN